jgi:hypothetical protein
MDKNQASPKAGLPQACPQSDERALFEDAYLLFGTRAEESAVLMRDDKGEYIFNETKDSWMTWQFARGRFETDDAHQDWVNRVVVHVNECDASIVALEGHYKHLQHHLKDCSSVDEGNALKDKLNAFLATQPGNRARVAEVAKALASM